MLTQKPQASRRAFLRGNFHETSDEVHISSLIVHAKPDRLADIQAAIVQLPDTELHASNDQGKIVVVLETETEGAILERIDRIGALPDVRHPRLLRGRPRRQGEQVQGRDEGALDRGRVPGDRRRHRAPLLSAGELLRRRAGLAAAHRTARECRAGRRYCSCGVAAADSSDARIRWNSAASRSGSNSLASLKAAASTSPSPAA